MKTPTDPPKKKKAENPVQPPREKKGPAPDEERPSRAADGPDTAKNENPSEEELNTAWSAPVTNQDEQDKITNTGGDDLPLADN